MTIPEYVANQTERVADSLAYFLSVMPAERLNWKPELPGAAPTRSALEQVSECIGVNRLVAKVLRGEVVAGSHDETEFADGDEAQKLIQESAAELTAAIRAMTEADLTRVYAHPRAQIPGENLIMMCYRNMAYHAGQINLLQMLYGDAEFHVPPKWR